MTTVLLAFLLTFISYKLLTRGYITWHNESLHAKHSKLEDANEPLLGEQDGTHEASGSPLNATLLEGKVLCALHVR